MLLLRYRPRSIAEARQRMTDQGFEPGVIEETISQAIATEQLDDAAFAKLWVRDRIWHHPLSRNAIAQELQVKGIARALVVSTLDAEYPPIREIELATELARGRMQRLSQLDPDKRQRRVLGLLARRGFSRGVSLQVVRSTEQEMTDATP